MAFSDFTIKSWPAGSRVTLANVPWNSDYRDIVRFNSTNDLNLYIMNNQFTHVDIERNTYLKMNEPVRLSVPFNAAMKFNYLRAHNPAMGNDGEAWLYYFILDVRYLAPDTTEFVVQLDVWQTFGRQAEFGNCYIERGHIGIANERALEDMGREFLTTPEGFDLGAEYGIPKTYSKAIADKVGQSFDIIVASTVSFSASGGTVDDPKLAAAGGNSYEGLPNGCELYYFESAAEFIAFMEEIKDKPWISQGIISITAVPDLVNPEFSWSYSEEGTRVRMLTGNGMPARQLDMGVEDWRDDLVNDFIPKRYEHLKKFLTSPYSFLEMTTHAGTPLLLRPECMPTGRLRYWEMLHLAPPGPRAVYFPYRYNAQKTRTGGYDDGVGVVGANDNAEFLDMTTGLVNLPTFAVVNNAYLAYMASNMNAIAYQHSSADWSQQKALQGNALAASQATAGMGAQQNQMQNNLRAQSLSTAITNDAATSQAIIGGATGMVGGAAGGPAGLASAGVGVAGSAASTAVGISARNQQLAVSQGAQRANMGSQMALGTYQRDSNKDYADMAAQGDYANAIGAINAKVQDARMIQPTTSGQVGGDAFLLAAHRWEVTFKIKIIQAGAMAAIGEFWLRYGYAIGRFATPPKDLMCMDKFTYWKMKETYLKALPAPEPIRQAIRGIFEKGVTVWANPADIGTIDIGTNKAKAGISL